MPQPNRALYAPLVMTLLAAASAHAMQAGPSAHADILDASGTKVGAAHLTQQGDDIAVSLSVTGISPGLHGAHIHTTGTCDAPGFAGAQGHWNPAGAHHGLKNPEGHHSGDMPNIDVDADGKGALDFTIANASITGGDTPLLDADGAALVIHAGPDDMMSDPSGNSGGRIACGVIMAD
ncbi:MAG: superoxide dismutase family protein [Sphingobium sp.]